MGVKKFKLGHAGTLDPLATGLLVLCCGKATKEITQLTQDQKTYTGEITLGQTTASYDLESEPEGDFPLTHIDTPALQKAAKALTGNLLQTPPIFSAKKVDGKRAYDLARAGKEVALKQNAIEVFTFDLTHIEIPKVSFEIACSKGTYIRSLAHDFGQELDSGAHLSALRRTVSGDYSIDGSKSVDQALEWISKLD